MSTGWALAPTPRHNDDLAVHPVGCSPLQSGINGRPSISIPRVPPRRRSAQMLYDFRAELEYNRAGLGMSMEAIQIFSPMFWAEGLRGAVMSLAPVVGAGLGLAFAVTALAAFWRRA